MCGLESIGSCEDVKFVARDGKVWLVSNRRLEEEACAEPARGKRATR